MIFPKEPLRGLRLDWDGEKYNLVFGPISGDLYSQLNARTALLIYSGIITREQYQNAFGPGAVKPKELQDIYDWYRAEGKKAWRFDPFKWVRFLILKFMDWFHIPTYRVKFLEIQTRRTVRDFPMLGFGIHRLEKFE